MKWWVHLPGTVSWQPASMDRLAEYEAAGAMLSLCRGNDNFYTRQVANIRRMVQDGGALSEPRLSIGGTMVDQPVKSYATGVRKAEDAIERWAAENVTEILLRDG